MVTMIPFMMWTVPLREDDDEDANRGHRRWFFGLKEESMVWI